MNKVFNDMSLINKNKNNWVGSCIENWVLERKADTTLTVNLGACNKS